MWHKKSVFAMLICICIIFSSVNPVFAGTFDKEFYLGEGLVKINASDAGNGNTAKLNMANKTQEIQSNYASGVKAAITAEYANKVVSTLSTEGALAASYDLVEDIKFTWTGVNASSKSIPITDFASIKSFLESNSLANILTVTYVSGNITYSFRMPSRCTKVYVEDDDDGLIESRKARSSISKKDMCSSKGASFTAEQVEMQHLLGKSYKDSLTFLEDISNSAKLGLFIGAFGVSYNVGFLYSNQQLPLSTVLEKSGNGYDFKQGFSLNASLDYFIHPFTGKVSFDGPAPTTLDEWLGLLSEDGGASDFDSSVFNFVQGKTVYINSDYMAFANSVSDKQINSEGLKITDYTIQGGVRIPQGVSVTVPSPKSVINYVMEVGYPRFFQRDSSGDTYSLNTNELGVLEDYRFCVYNNKFYSSSSSLSEPICSLSDLGIPRANIFLYRTLSDGYPRALVVAGAFTEAIVDSSGNTTNGNLYTTGRTVLLGKSYSSKLKLDSDSPNYFGYQTYQTGVLGVDAKKYFFGVSEDIRDSLDNNALLFIPGLAIQSGAIEGSSIVTDEADEVDSTSESAVADGLEYQKVPSESISDVCSILSSAGYHVDIGLPEYIQLKATFGQDANGHYGFYLVRNNYYSADKELIDYLGDNPASEVDAKLLLARLTGDFTGSIEKLSYGDWRAMQDIKAELSQEQKSKPMHIFNVVRYVLGAFLILYGLLIALAGCLDSTGLLEVECLPILTFGGMRFLPEGMSSMVDAKGYVSFTRVLISACGLLLLGVLLITGDDLIYFANFLFVKFSSIIR